MKINNKFCKIHNLEYNYICPNCVEPFLEKTKFSSLSEIRQYQKENAQKVNTNDIIDEINRLGFMKIKNLKDTSYSGALIYDCKEKATLKSYFRRNKLSFSAYFPSILFLNQTELYLDLIKTIKEKLDCYIINSSGQLHPYLFGSACDFGLRINTPVIGYTKKLLFGYVEINEEPQNFHRIYSNDHLIGFA
ncbi:MAG: endonuclease V, partial [Promethearchaeota archaeon]